MLDAVDLSMTLKKKVYKSVRDAQIDRIFELSELVYERKRPVIIVFEGWDAAGKGTTIRQLTAPLDARGFKVLATQAPRTHETLRPWLWRFWMNIPRYGQIAIFDRSWYGRVMIERVNGLTPMPQWIAAYEEINNFERTLAEDGTIFIKFWLHISKDEQLRRFMQLAVEPETAWRVTAEDWENHRRYEEYLAAVRDMLQKTHTPVAPWAVIPSHDGDVRLFSVFDTIIARLETALDVTRSEWPTLDELAEKGADGKNPRKSAEKDKKTKKKEDKPEKKAGKGKKKKKKPDEVAPGAAVQAAPEANLPQEAQPPKNKKKKLTHTPAPTAPSDGEPIVADVSEPQGGEPEQPPAPGRRRKRTTVTPEPVASNVAEADHA